MQNAEGERIRLSPLCRPPTGPGRSLRSTHYRCPGSSSGFDDVSAAETTMTGATGNCDEVLQPTATTTSRAIHVLRRMKSPVRGQYPENNAPTLRERGSLVYRMSGWAVKPAAPAGPGSLPRPRCGPGVSDRSNGCVNGPYRDSLPARLPPACTTGRSPDPAARASRDR